MKLGHGISGIVAGLALMAASSSAQAGVFTSASSSNMWGGVVVPTPIIDSEDAGHLSATATLQDTMDGTVLGIPTNGNFGFKIGGTIVGDPTVDVFEKVTNNTGLTWTDYTVTISPGPGLTTSAYAIDTLVTSGAFVNATTYFTGVPSIVTVAGVTTLTFTGGPGVAPTQKFIIGFSFDITDSGGDFAYAIANHPTAVPEPASLALMLPLGLLLRRKR